MGPMLPALVVFFTAGLITGSFAQYFPLSIFCLLSASAVVSACLEGRGRIASRDATILFLSFLAGIVYWSWTVEGTNLDRRTDDEQEMVQEVSGRIVEPVQQAPDRLVMMIQADGPTVGDIPSKRIKLTWRTPERALFQGDRIRFRGKLRAPGGSLNPGGFDYAAYLERHSVEAVSTVSGPEGVELLESGRGDARWILWNQFDRWRERIRTAAIRTVSQPALGVYLGIILGDQGYLDPDIRDQFMVTGTVHLLSISGSHLGLVAILTFLLVRRMLLLLPATWLLRLSRTTTPTRVAALTTVFPVVFYACLAGAELATIRSLFMILTALLVRWLGYEQRIFHALALAAAIMLVHDSRAVYDISFQLSFLSVGTIAAWLQLSANNTETQPVEPPRLQRALGWARDTVLISAVITLVTFPLVAFYFNQLPWLGLLTNLLAVPVMGLVLVPIGLLAGVWELIDGGMLLPWGSSIQVLTDLYIRGLAVAARIPWAEWHVASPSIPMMSLFYVSLMVLWIKPKKVVVRWLAGVCVFALVLWWGWSPRLSVDGERFRVMFLDVAQGDSTVLELPGGQVVLIDGGPTYERFDMGRGVVGPYLWNRGIRAIDYVIATHPQLDHVGGLAWVLDHFSVGSYWGIGMARDEVFYDRLEKARLRRGLTEHIAQSGETIELSPDCRLSIENPPDIGALLHDRKGGRDLNNRSIVTRLLCGGHTMLFPADVERDALTRMTVSRREPVEVLKVPHHGAASSLDAGWVTSLQPAYAVISVGRHNPYGHPAATVLQVYDEQGIPLWRTDRDGGVWITGGRLGSSLEIHTTRSQRIQPTIPSSVWNAEKSNWERLGQQWLQRM
ncbi:MAG TPA: DNA internalization-related competence protein ComEC/Rec2 [Nitrospira sp.]|nr:DNA internalization-related competence protein ComEC/Rec2 [Nitrospira sp.]